MPEADIGCSSLTTAIQHIAMPLEESSRKRLAGSNMVLCTANVAIILLSFGDITDSADSEQFATA